jgi:hypothetical protein
MHTARLADLVAMIRRVPDLDIDSQPGGTLGVAIVGTVVNNSLTSDLAARVPASVAQQLTPAG